MVAQDISTLSIQDKYTRYSNTYFVAFTDLFSVRLDIKQVSSQVKMVNNGSTALIITSDQQSLDEIHKALQQMFKLQKAIHNKPFFQFENIKEHMS